MGKRVVLMAAAWLAGAAAAAVGVTAALSFLGTGLFGASSPPMSQAEVVKNLAAISSGAPSPSPASSSPAPPAQSTPAETTGSQSTSGGMVYATCSAGLVRMTSTPKLGYVADDLAAGPARSAWVTFKSGSAEVHVTVSCTGGKPAFRVTADDHGGATTAPAAPPTGGGGDDHGGGRGGGSGGGRGGGGGGGSGGGGGGHDG
jgi:uncharacterized membrane protein YgcG